jgi:ActR/RegA family two-component response regulator
MAATPEYVTTIGACCVDCGDELGSEEAIVCTACFESGLDVVASSDTLLSVELLRGMQRRLAPGTSPTRVTGGCTTGRSLRWSPGYARQGRALRSTDATRARATMSVATDPAEGPRAESAKLRAVDGARSLGGECPRLVIADDDPVVQLVLGMSLGHEFDVVGVAADSEHAIELARVNQPDAALVDVVMPKGGGLRAVRGILEVAPDTAIVMLSGYKAEGIVGELIKAGAIAYRRKGAEAHVLADALTESIKVHTAERRESASTILGWYCMGLDSRSRRWMGRESA